MPDTKAAMPDVGRKDQAIVGALDLAMKQLQVATNLGSGDADRPGLAGADTNWRGAGAEKPSPKRKKQDRAETPQFEETLPEEEERGQALLLLQRVIRGRAYQNRMFEGTRVSLPQV